MAASSLPLPAAIVGLTKLPAQSKIGLLLAVAALIALGMGSWLWSTAPDYRTLYANVSDQDGGAIIAALEQMNIQHKFSEGGGAIMVPAAQVHEARLKLASQGLPKGTGVGFDLMDNQKFGTTQFQEQVNYQRALEGELARTIQTLSAVTAARVHLAIPRQSVFLRDAQKPSASVVLTLAAGRTLDRAQVAGVVHLVASSVPSLPPQSVSVLDQYGTLLSNAGDKGAGALDPSQLSYVSQIETNYSKRILDMLEPIVGRANVRAQVTAEVDFSESESMAESYKPNQGGDAATAAVRSQQTSEDQRGGAGPGAGGVPGALSNQPAAPATANISGGGAKSAAGPAAGSTSGGGSARRDATVNYEVDKTVQRVRNPVGNVKRLSAAVVVNFRKVAEAKAADAKADEDKAEAPKAKPVPLTPEEVQQITALVKETIGFSEKRGDSVNVTNVAFTPDEPVAAAPEQALWEKPDNIALAKEIGRDVLIAVLALYLFLGVLRPLMQQLATAAPVVEAPEQPQLLQPPPPGANPDHLQAAKQLARSDPQVVASVVRGWVNADG
ncbi:MAG TPA: flagellar basal-body MS-ring/collar protein FliF [Burkholderiales bacterium]|nr:flagellar basal-body MS-ring/collar protein FliF [Burkholderiales bacterium]